MIVDLARQHELMAHTQVGRKFGERLDGTYVVLAPIHAGRNQHESREQTGNRSAQRRHPILERVGGGSELGADSGPDHREPPPIDAEQAGDVVGGRLRVGDDRVRRRQQAEPRSIAAVGREVGQVPIRESIGNQVVAGDDQPSGSHGCGELAVLEQFEGRVDVQYVDVSAPDF